MKNLKKLVSVILAVALISTVAFALELGGDGKYSLEFTVGKDGVIEYDGVSDTITFEIYANTTEEITFDDYSEISVLYDSNVFEVNADDQENDVLTTITSPQGDSYFYFWDGLFWCTESALKIDPSKPMAVVTLDVLDKENAIGSIISLDSTYEALKIDTKVCKVSGSTAVTGSAPAGVEVEKPADVVVADNAAGYAVYTETFNAAVTGDITEENTVTLSAKVLNKSDNSEVTGKAITPFTLLEKITVDGSGTIAYKIAVVDTTDSYDADAYILVPVITVD